MAILTPEGVRLSDFAGRPVNRKREHILWDPILAEKGGYKHFMLKEICQMPGSSLSGRQMSRGGETPPSSGCVLSALKAVRSVPA
jgi:glucosamine--fructose-6-phosphate aminotransferase (isomerizing)